jgi:hypothetical protein
MNEIGLCRGSLTDSGPRGQAASAEERRMTNQILDEKDIGWLQDQAVYIAAAIRHAMEGFHGKHLSDEQMKELNPIIRNAIYTAMYGAMVYKQSAKASRYVAYIRSMIPDYWEAAALLVDFNDTSDRVPRDPAEPG